MTRVAITGATGFIGRHILTALASRAEVRALSRRARPERPGVAWIPGRLEDEAALRDLVVGADLVIHAAGLIKARRAAEFFDCNRDGTARLLAAIAAAAPGARLVHLSSLAARAPQLSAYAASKSAAEDLVRQHLPAGRRLIVRPPGVYGPGDREILKLIRVATRGILPAPGRIDNRVALVYGPDLARLIAGFAFAAAPWGKTLEVDDGRAEGYDYAELARVLGAVIGRPVRPLAIPAPALQGLAATADLLAFLSGRPATLSRGKARELLHPDWLAAAEAPSVARAVPETPTDLVTGLRHSCAWARDRGLL